MVLLCNFTPDFSNQFSFPMHSTYLLFYPRISRSKFEFPWVVLISNFPPDFSNIPISRSKFHFTWLVLLCNFTSEFSKQVSIPLGSSYLKFPPGFLKHPDFLKQVSFPLEVLEIGIPFWVSPVPVVLIVESYTFLLSQKTVRLFVLGQVDKRLGGHVLV